MNKKTKKLNQQNNLLDKQIAKENQEIFTNMIYYLRGANASEYEIESVRQDLTEMVISAQTRGEDISTLFNGDYKGFCDQVIENLPPRSWQQKLIGSLDMVCWVLSILFLINIVISKSTIDLIGALVNKSKINWNISVTIGNLITILLIIVLANIIVQYIIKNSFKKELKHKKLVGAFIGAGLTLAFLGIAFAGQKTLFTVHLFVAIALTVGLFVVHKILEAVGE